MPRTIGWGGRGLELRRAMTCESCGQPFRCELALGGCWCKDVPLTDAERTAIRARYRDCLCPECLKKHYDSPAVGINTRS